MPSSVKIPREDIIGVTYKIVKEQGIEAATTKAITQKLDCSVKPIYYAFTNMEGLMAAVAEKAMDKYTRILLSEVTNVRRTKALGINYMRFAKDFPHLFKLLFCTDKHEEVRVVNTHMDKNKPLIVKLIAEDCGVDEARAERIYIKIGIFCHGLAMLAVFKSAQVDDADVGDLITEVFNAIVKDTR